MTFEHTYRAIAAYLAEHGYAPSLREIMEHAGLSSTSVAAYHVRQLEVQGRLLRGAGGQSRAIRLTTPGPNFEHLYWQQVELVTALREEITRLGGEA